MKKKITAALLCIALAVSFSCTAFAQNAPPVSYTHLQGRVS